MSKINLLKTAYPKMASQWSKTDVKNGPELSILARPLSKANDKTKQKNTSIYTPEDM